MATKRKEAGKEDEITLAAPPAEQAKKKRAAKAKRPANDEADEDEDLDDEYADQEAEEDAADFAPRSAGTRCHEGRGAHCTPGVPCVEMEVHRNRVASTRSSCGLEAHLSAHTKHRRGPADTFGLAWGTIQPHMEPSSSVPSSDMTFHTLIAVHSPPTTTDTFLHT